MGFIKVNDPEGASHVLQALDGWRVVELIRIHALPIEANDARRGGFPVSKNAPRLSILTANRLGDGAVAFLDFEGAWSENIAEALVAHSPDEVRALEDRGAYDAACNLVVEPYLVEIREVAGRFEPIRYRERVRAAGPSMLDHVPGYAAPSPSPRASPTSPHASSARGEGAPVEAA